MKLLLRAVLCVTASAFIFLASIFLTTVSAQDSSHNLTAIDEFQVQIAADPEISPDGKKIVYVRRFADPMTDKRYSNLWVINADATSDNAVRLTTSPKGSGSEQPSWSPDGKKIVFARGSSEAESDSIMIMAANGDNPTTMDLGALTSNGQPEWGPEPAAPPAPPSAPAAEAVTAAPKVTG